MPERDFITLAPAVIRERVDAAGLNARGRAHLLTDEIHAYLRTAIRTGALRHGSRIPTERALAQAFAASRKTIRDALDRLDRDGLIVRKVGSGGYVTWPQPARSEEVSFQTPSVSPLDAIEARRVIEPNMCDFAAVRATEDDFVRMAARLHEMQTARDLVAFRAAGYAFHLEVARATRNPLLVAIYEMLIAARAKAGWGTLIPLNDRQEQRDAQIAGNRALYEALLARDAEAARRLSYQTLSEMIAAIAAFPPNA